MSQEFNIVGNLLLKVDGAEAGLNKLKNSLSKLEMPKGLENSFKKSFSNLDGLFEKYKAQLKDGFNTKGDISSFAKTGRQIEAEYDKISAAVTKLTGKEVSLKVDLSAIQKAEKELENLIVQRDKLTKDVKGGLGLTKMFEAMQASDVGRRGTKVFDASNVLQTSLGRGDLEKAKTDVETLISELNRMSEARKQALENRTGTSFSSIIDTLRNSIVDADNSLDELNGDIKTTSDSMANMRADQMEKVGQAIEDAVGDADRLTSGFKQINGGAQEAAQSMYSMTHQLEQLKTSTQYFFSLSNMLNLFKRGVREAVQTVKDLDAAMTETAVVTDFSVGDMWEKLPEYTAQANSLGATIQDMYESTTLYYQQGLNTQQAMGIATETMKMARIAGLEAADATDMMTAALRGFNMEINEASAQHINDVYSQLAAKTASDTEELGTAMQRTASIAHSAGMSFEGTTAFLAQAIETTREPAENLGTAMKTIIARFQELKKNPLEMQEVDGEIVDYNKVDAALKTIGVDLKDTNGQFRALDDVFLDISQRWDGLSQTQQRYIATTAAGSRQQSRFIAMMSDYNRTMELMGYANDSAGASQAQFNKTLDSLEAKLNKFKTAWQQFLMGIMNDSWTKGIVDGATTVLSTVNKLIDKLSFGSKGIKSFLSIFTAFTGLKTAGRLANMAIGGLGGILDPKSSVFKGMFSGASGMKQGANAAQAKAISDPIVTVLKQIYAKMNDNKVTEEGLTRGSWKDFKNAQSKFQTNAKTGTIGDTIGALNGLDKAQINGVLANNPAIESRLQRGFNKYIADMDLTEGTKKATSKAIPGIFKAFKQDPNMSPDAFVKALRPDQIGVSLVKAGQGEAGKELIRQFAKQRDDAFMKSVGYDPTDASSVANYKSLFNSKDKGKGLREAYVDFIKNYKGAEGGALPEPSKWDNVASKVGAVGAMFGTAGQAVTSFGMALSNLGLEKVGNGIASLGTHLSSIGASISSVAMTISAVSNAGGLKQIFAPVVPYLPYIIAAAAALVTIGVIAHQAAKETQAIKDSAEEVTKTFEETSEKTKENISNLKQYKDEMARLSKGVDQNGNNVNLSNDEYDEYLKIVDEVAAMNPEIVRGYNAQGHAIIDNNTALQKTLDLQEQINKETTDQYLQQTSLEKLLAARNLRGSDYTKNTTFVGEKMSRSDLGRTQFMYGDSNYGIHKSDFKKQIIPLQKQAVKVAKELQSSDLYKQDEKQVKSLLSTYGIDFDQLLEGEKKSVDNFVKNQDAIESQLSSAAENLDVDFSDKFNKAFENLNIDTDAFNAAIEPIFKNLATRVSNDSTFKDIAPELQSSVMAGLKEIAKQDISASEMIQQSNELVGVFRNLADQSGEYGEAIRLVEAEQEKFSDSLDEEAYAKGVQPAIDKLYELRDAAAEMHTVTGDAVAEFYDNQIAQVENFASSGIASLNEALNTMSGQFAEAKGAYEEFSNAVKDNDFYTAADNMKKIFDEIDNEVDKAGLGSKKFWMGAEELLGSENIDGLSKEAVAKQLNNIKPLLQEGEDGFQAFWDLIDQHKDKLNELDGVKVGEDGWLEKWPDDLSEVSKELGISEKLLASLLDKSRQFAHIDLSDPTKVREAIATSGTAISGLQGDKKNLYVKEDSLRASLRESDYTTKAEQDHEIERMQNEEQIITIGNPKDLSNEQVSAMKKDLGLGDLPGLIETFGQTGEYNKEEMQALAERFDLFDDQKGFDEAYNDWVEKSLDPAQSKQTDLLGQLNSNVASIAASVVSKRIQEGHLDKPTAEQSEYATYGQKGVADTLGQLFSKGKDGNGNYFQSDASFERNKKAIEEQKKSYEDYLAVLKEGRENAKGSEKEKFDKEIASYEKMVGYLDQWIKDGEAAYNKHKQEEESNKEQSQSDTKKEDSKKDTEDKKPETTYDEERLKKQQEFWSNIDSKVFGFFDKIFTTDFGEQGRTQKSTAGKGIDITDTPTEDPAEAARQAAREKFQSWIQGLIEGSQNTSEDPKTIAAQKARDDYKSYIDGIREGAINQKMTGGIDAEAQAKTREKITSMWQAVKAAFTSGGTEDPKVEAGKKAADIWKSIWSNVKKAFSSDPKVDIDPKTNGKGKTNNKETTETTGDLNVSYTGKVANPDEVKASLERQITSLLNTIASQQSKLSATAKVNVKQGTIEKPKAQKATVNYTKGKQAKADNQTAAVNYTLGKQAAPQPKTTTVNYTLGRQANPSPKTVNISPNFVGTWRKTLTIDHGAKGKNNNITTSPLPTFGSAAKGARYGKVGPKGKGGLTLTGEEGFEIAWLPSESKSMIVGADGPQLLNLPSDAVIYTHEQSKKIVKQKSIPAGSHRGESSKPVVNRGGSGGTSGGTSKGKGKGSDTSKGKGTNTTPKEVTTVVKKAGTVLVWWENVARRMDSAQRKAEKTQKTLNKLLKAFGTTADEYKKAGQVYKQQLQKVQDIAKEKINKANTELNYTVNGKSSGKTAAEAKKQSAAKKELDAAKANLKKAKKTKSTKDDKKAKKKVKAAQKAYNKTAGAQKDAAVNAELESIGARQEISYSVTKKTTKTNKKGKKKTTTKETTKKESVNLANYIKYEDGVAIIDQSQIDAIAKTNKSKAEAIKQAAEKQINDLNNKLKTAQDELEKAQEEYAQFLNDTYDAFYAWDRSITQVYLLAQELEKLGNLRNIYEAANEKEFAKLTAGIDYDAATNGFSNVIKALPKVTEALNQTHKLLISQVTTNYNKMSAAYDEYINELTGQNAIEKYLRANAGGTGDSENAIQAYEAAKATQQFLKDAGLTGEQFDLNKAFTALETLYDKKWKGDDYDKIKEGLDKIAEKQNDYYNAVTETYQSITEVYGLIEEYQSYISDFEKSLISGIEEQSKQEIDRLSKLDSSINNAIKDLLDEVKRKLDERRRQEDNKKTEQDISQKQQRLAALQADTSGGHQVEIAQLQKEIAESKQNYERTLEDQLLDRLSQQQDLAAQQRQHQIELLEAQNTLAAQLGTNVEEVNKWLANPDQYFNDIRAAWLAQQGYEEAGAAERKQLEEQFITEYTRFGAYAQALPGLIETATSNALPDTITNGVPTSLSDIESRLDSIIGLMPVDISDILKTLGDNILSLNSSDNKKTMTASEVYATGADVKAALNISDTQGQRFTFKELQQAGYNGSQLKAGGFTGTDFGANGVSYAEARKTFSYNELLNVSQYKQQATAEKAAADKAAAEQKAAAQRQANITAYNNYMAARKKDKKLSGTQVDELIRLGSLIGKGPRTVLNEIVGGSGADPFTWENIMGALLKSKTVTRWNLAATYGSSSNAVKKLFEHLKINTKKEKDAFWKEYNQKKPKALAYASGGLADYTGPAWLDGTPSKPELVLNAQDTQNFLALRDVLSKAIGSTNSINNSYGGDNIFEINVNVDKIEKDYDVDRVIEKVKKEITKGAGYRNVTQVRNFR